jgi:DNA-binding protein HU-beta
LGRISLYIIMPFPYDCYRAGDLCSPKQKASELFDARCGAERWNETIPFDIGTETGESIRRIMAITRMTQTQLVKSLAEKVQVPNKTAKEFLAELSGVAIAEVKKNGMFVLPGIGRLVRVDRKARIGRNPATGESIKIPAKKVVKFRVAKAAKDAIVPPKKK